MRHPILAASALTASLTLGIVVGLAAAKLAGSGEEPSNVKSITGVGSGVKGSAEAEPEKKGVDQISVPPEVPDSTPPSAATSESKASPQHAAEQNVAIEGVKGTDGVTTERENVIEIQSSSAGTMQSIRGIKGIDTVMLQNLETVLRMQSPPPPPEGGGGGVRAAAALMTMENDGPPDPEAEVDGRQELTESELEGS